MIANSYWLLNIAIASKIQGRRVKPVGRNSRSRVLSIRPNIREIPDGGANGTDIFRNFRHIIPQNSVQFDHSCLGLASPILENEFNMIDSQASK